MAPPPKTSPKKTVVPKALNLRPVLHTNSKLILLAEDSAGDQSLAELCALLKDGIPIETAVKQLRINSKELERLRRADTDWGNHVNNSINIAEAEFEAFIVGKLLNSQSRTDVDIANAYQKMFKPKFEQAAKLRLEYEINTIFEAVKLHCTEEQFLAMLDTLGGFDGQRLVLKWDEFLLPRDGSEGS